MANELHKCPRCGSPLIETISMSGMKTKTWRKCSNSFCGAMVDTFKPTPMQYNFCKDNHSRKGTFGGFGSGKSFAAIKDIEKHILITPGGYIAVIGFTYRQIKRNFKKDFEEDFPKDFMEIGKNQKIPGYSSQDHLYTFKNGCKLELITADEEGKIRGLNATKILIIEASNVTGKITETAKSRLRNNAASVFQTDEFGNVLFEENEKTGQSVPIIKASWINMTFESNPDAGYILKNILLISEFVQFYGSSYEKYPYRIGHIDDNFSAHISATDSNPYLPPDYLEINTKNKPIWEVRRFYYGSFLFSADMIYPRVNEIIVDPYPINLMDDDVYVIIGYDYGLSDKSAFTFGAINFRTNIITFYDELVVKELDAAEIAKEYRKKLALIPDGKLLFLPKMDAKSYNKRDANKKTIGSTFEDMGLYFEPIQEGQEVRTLKVNTLINSHQIRIFRSLNNLVEEITEYKWVVNSKGERTNKRTDRRNHSIDSMEFALISIPYNLEKMTISNYIKPGQSIIADAMRRKPKKLLTEDQVRRIKLNPLKQNMVESYKGHMPSRIKYEDDEIEDILSKLSGIGGNM